MYKLLAGAAAALTFTPFFSCNGLKLNYSSVFEVFVHPVHNMPSTIVSNSHLAGLASLHRGGGGGPQVAEIHYKKM